MNQQKLEKLLHLEKYQHSDDPLFHHLPISPQYAEELDTYVEALESKQLKEDQVQTLHKSREDKRYKIRLQRMNKIAKLSQLTDGWFGMKSQDQDEETKNQYLMLKLKKYIDPKSAQKGSDLKSVPKYFQIGTYLEGGDNFGLKQKIRKTNKQSIVDQFLSLDYEKSVSRKKFGEIQSRQQKLSRVNQKLKRLKGMSKRMGKNIIDVKIQYPNLSELSVQELSSLKRRNIFHEQQYNKWLKSRYPSIVQHKYLYYPEEIQLQMEVKQIFNILDINKSEVISISQMFLMFKHFGYEVSKNDLKKIYEFVDINKDKALDFDEFTHLTQNSSALRQFRLMMKKLIQMQDQYVPLSVGAMITHLAYMLKREKLMKEALNEPNLTIAQKYQLYIDLINIKESKSLVDEAFEGFVKAQKRLLEIKSSGIELEVPKKPSYTYRKSFSTINGLQPLLYQNLQKQDAIEINEMAELIKRKTVMLELNELSDLSFDKSISDEEEKTKEEELRVILEEATERGKQLASISNSSSLQICSSNIITLPKISVRMYSQKIRISKEMLKRKFHIDKFADPVIESQRSNNPNSTLASGDQTQLSINPSTWSNRVLKGSLPQLT